MAKFKRGESGNPDGRPKGIRDRRVRYRDLIEPHVPDLVRRLVASALEGDTQACRLLLDRVIPSLRAEAAPLRLTGSEQANPAREDVFIDSMVRGDLAPDRALTAVLVLKERAQLRELQELETRLARLEGSMLLKHEGQG